MSQTLQKDNVFTLHVFEYTLKEGVTKDQLLKFVSEEYVPAVNEAFEDMSVVNLGGIRGEHENMLGFIHYYESEEMLEKYWPEAGGTSDIYDESLQKVSQERQRLSELIDLSWVTGTTWEVEPTAEEDTTVTSSVPAMLNNFSAYPNPFSDNITFEYNLQQSENVRFEVFNSLGQLVATPVHGVQQAGKNRFQWNGCDHSGNTLKAGVYNVRLQTANSVRAVETIIKLSK